jgi:hypothetical protein
LKFCGCHVIFSGPLGAIYSYVFTKQTVAVNNSKGPLKWSLEVCI